jgi:hypothetical protein
MLTRFDRYLNIYRPATANENSNLPVRVWIHVSNDINMIGIF